MQETFPHSDQAERSVLGSMLLNGRECVDEALTALREDDFYQPLHRDIFAAMEELTDNGQAVDAVTVEEKLKETGTGAGVFEYLADLAHDVISPANLAHHIQLVKEKSALRKVISVCTQISAQCRDGTQKADTLLSQAGDAIGKITLEGSGRQVIPIRKAIYASYAQMAEAMKNKGGIAGVRAGFPTMDRMLSGFQKDQLIVIAARPGMGKTSFALNAVHHASLSQQSVCLVFSLEMSAEQLASRLLCSQAHVDMQLTRTGRLGTAEFGRLAEAVRQLASAPIYVDDSASLTVTEMAAKARHLRRQTGLDMIVIDYLQLMGGSGRAENRNQEVAQITRALKIMAKELEVPVVVLSQLSRQGEKDGSRIPKLSDLRESGAIEQDADVVIFLQRDDYYVDQRTEENTGKASIIIAKQRNGPTGSVNVRWNGQYTRYMEADNSNTYAETETAEY